MNDNKEEQSIRPVQPGDLYQLKGDRGCVGWKTKNGFPFFVRRWFRTSCGTRAGLYRFPDFALILQAGKFIDNCVNPTNSADFMCMEPATKTKFELTKEELKTYFHFCVEATSSSVEHKEENDITTQK